MPLLKMALPVILFGLAGWLVVVFPEASFFFFAAVHLVANIGAWHIYVSLLALLIVFVS